MQKLTIFITAVCVLFLIKEQKSLSVLILHSKYTCSALKRALMSRDMKIDENNQFLLTTSGHFPQMDCALKLISFISPRDKDMLTCTVER